MKELRRSITTALESPNAQSAAVVLLSILLACVFALNVDRYFFLGDDAFISFRYAKNLAMGHGIVWNPGEYVEGYTNFLWVLILAAGMRLGLSPETLS
ncbi:MAG: arabinofuranosyltransferase, partial [Myxococcota bacterium]